MKPSLSIRPARAADADAIWAIFEPIIAGGDTYVFAPGTPREDVLRYWFQPGGHVFVAEYEGHVVGSSLIRPNQPGLGDHVANGAFIVAQLIRRLGVGRTLGEHALAEARALGFRAMQFNFVVATNTGAIALWKDLGFSVVGTLPGAFRHAQLGEVDALVMFRSLED